MQSTHRTTHRQSCEHVLAIRLRFKKTLFVKIRFYTRKTVFQPIASNASHPSWSNNQAAVVKALISRSLDESKDRQATLCIRSRAALQRWTAQSWRSDKGASVSIKNTGDSQRLLFSGINFGTRIRPINVRVVIQEPANARHRFASDGKTISEQIPDVKPSKLPLEIS